MAKTAKAPAIQTSKSRQYPEKLPDRFEGDFGDQIQTFSHYLNKSGGAIDRMLSRRIPADLFLSTALTAARQTPGLLACSPLSIFGGIFEAAQLALSFGNQLGHIFLVPYRGHATLQIGYKAYHCLAFRSGGHIEAENVFKGEKFRVYGGDEIRIEHEINPNIDRTNADLIVFSYAVLTVPTGMKQRAWLTREAILKRRAASPAWRAGQTNASKRDSPWYVWFETMSKKSATRSVGTTCGIVDIQRAASLDEWGDTIGAVGKHQRELVFSAADVLNVRQVPPDQIPGDDEAPEELPPAPPEQPTEPPKRSRRGSKSTTTPPTESEPKPPELEKPASQKQVGFMYGKAGEMGVTKERLKAYCQHVFGCEVEEVPASKVKLVVTWIQQQRQEADTE